MKLKPLFQLLSPKDIRNGFLGISVTLGGLGLAFLTLYAHRTGNAQLAGIAAMASLGFVLLILVFVVPPLARNASAEASQMNLPFEVTVGGAMFLGLLVIVGFSAWNTGNNLLFLVLSFLCSAFIVAFFLGKACLKKLDVKMRFPETIFAEEITPVLVSLHNRKFFFPTVSVTAEIRGKEREESRFIEELKELLPEKWAKKFLRPPILKHTLDYFIYIRRRNSAENRAEHVFPKRGRFLIKDFELSTKFPLSLFRHRRRLSAQSVELIIFPKIEKISPEKLSLPLEAGKLSTSKRGSGQDLLSLREYQPTDDFRQINWKATARTQRLIVSEFTAEDEKRVTVVFLTQMKSSLKPLSLRQKIEAELHQKELSEDEKRFEKGVSLVASLMSHLADDNAEIRLIIDDQIGNFGVGIPHFHENLKRLSLIETKFTETENPKILDEVFLKLPKVFPKSHLYLVTTIDETLFTPDLVQETVILKF